MSAACRGRGPIKKWGLRRINQLHTMLDSIHTYWRRERRPWNCNVQFDDVAWNFLFHTHTNDQSFSTWGVGAARAINVGALHDPVRGGLAHAAGPYFGHVSNSKNSLSPIRRGDHPRLMSQDGTRRAAGQDDASRSAKIWISSDSGSSWAAHCYPRRGSCCCRPFPSLNCTDGSP